MADEITMKAINLLRSADPNIDEMHSLDKFIAHQGEVLKMLKQYEGYSNHPQAEKLNERLRVFEESAVAFTYVHTQMLAYKRGKLLADAREMEMANAVIELKQELDILNKLNLDE
tara:strand:- start:1220 stop:1564 length:345 start_codon:yes stop_codon:yes gene_type:complete